MLVAVREYTGQEEFDGEMEFIGRQLPYSHDRPEAALSKLATAGLVVVSARLIETGGETFYWIVARKPVARAGVQPTMMPGLLEGLSGGRKLLESGQ